MQFLIFKHALGSVVGGAVAGEVSNTVMGEFIEDDAKQMMEIIKNVFTEMAG